MPKNHTPAHIAFDSPQKGFTMAISDTARLDMLAGLRTHVGETVANTLIEHLPPGGWYDVRGDGEYAINHLPEASNIPVSQLRKRLTELDPLFPTVVYCAGGYRSSIAASVLRANGFRDVSDVLGGFEAILQVQN